MTINLGVYRLLVIVVAATVLALDVFTGEGIDAYYRSRLPDMVHGTAYRPYVSRALLPATARIATAALPSSARLQLTRIFQQWAWRPATWQPPYAAEYLLVTALMGLSLLLFAGSLTALFETMFLSSPTSARVTTLIALACVPLFFGPFSRQIYDFPTLWLTTLALMSMARGRSVAYAATFVLACLNKETAILLTMVFVAHVGIAGRQWRSRTFQRALVYQVAVFIVVRSALAVWFRDNPGGSFELHLFDHNRLVLTHPTLLSKRLLVLVGAVAVGCWRWQHKPAFLRHAFQVLAPSLVAAGVTVGQIDEIRVYFEVYPVIVLLVADSMLAVATGPPLLGPPDTARAMA